MQLVERIEKRRFVGREFLLWLWFESELFDGTLATEDHGSFGLWIERQTVLSVGTEATRIKGAYPAGHREAKESLLRGKLPESAGVHVSRADADTMFVIKADTMALGGLRLPTVLGGEEDTAALAPPSGPRRRAPERAGDDPHETFYERMRLTRETEKVMEALYRDFLSLRLSPAWNEVVVPAMRTWAADGAVDAEAYRAATPRATKRPRMRARA